MHAQELVKFPYFLQVEKQILSFGKIVGSAVISERLTGSQNQSFEVGPGNLKLVYSGNQGKLTDYINARSKVI